MADPARSMRVLRQALRSFRGDESGQSLIVIVSAMTVLLGIAAFAIDTANWMVRHHDAQVVADSAALAAAQCLANP
ncbi:MAG TPA: pilus assembly protein TadG-related protein, partial [Solirubrobacteraceae bacterium]|nr:pilus assembly protein TadG-related protein [Solirubrobacteraceae bacterium]